MFMQKINRKLHLSKLKHSKFDESAQLVAFYAISVVAGADIIYNVSVLQFVLCILPLFA